jgi:hypothetical protein
MKSDLRVETIPVFSSDSDFSRTVLWTTAHKLHMDTARLGRAESSKR